MKWKQERKIEELNTKSLNELRGESQAQRAGDQKLSTGRRVADDCRQTDYLKEPGKAGVIGHVLGQVGEQHGQVEANLFGRVVEALCELHVVDLAVMVTVTAHEQEVDLLSVGSESGREWSISCYLALKWFLSHVSLIRRKHAQMMEWVQEVDP